MDITVHLVKIVDATVHLVKIVETAVHFVNIEDAAVHLMTKWLELFVAEGQLELNSANPFNGYSESVTMCNDMFQSSFPYFQFGILSYFKLNYGCYRNTNVPHKRSNIMLVIVPNYHNSSRNYTAFT